MSLGKEPIMSTILIFNAVSSFLAAVAIAGFLAREQKRRARQTVIQPLYVTSRTTRTTRARAHR
jgi:hypothetical protein